jgi:hypothetical protein
LVHRQDEPSVDEKADLAESIVETFPVLKDETPTGYVCILLYHYLNVMACPINN